ncbi:hypothetical protein CSHISOI_02457 [Colletotrichum shisoi]|uniref:Uncharacterized protein n=1 Tax=Colletotrichum shisoi TaxID=2078593 RepID=A0A5Q4C102_9PEZI|nr:hypothetical protein CSHISOI_02457 [Colletotrichum shisoi]
MVILAFWVVWLSKLRLNECQRCRQRLYPAGALSVRGLRLFIVHDSRTAGPLSPRDPASQRERSMLSTGFTPMSTWRRLVKCDTPCRCLVPVIGLFACCMRLDVLEAFLICYDTQSEHIAFIVQRSRDLLPIPVEPVADNQGLRRALGSVKTSTVQRCIDFTVLFRANRTIYAYTTTGPWSCSRRPLFRTHRDANGRYFAVKASSTLVVRQLHAWGHA